MDNFNVNIKNCKNMLLKQHKLSCFMQSHLKSTASVSLFKLGNDVAQIPLC